MTALEGAVTLVTGASSGIGAATARRLHAEGATVVLVARREERLRDLAAELAGRVTVITADVAADGAPERLVAETIASHGRLDVLVANAGVMLLGPVESADPADWERMLRLNVGSTVALVRAALPALLDAATGGRGVADLVIVSSLAGRRSSSGSGVYALTKAGINAFAESLRQEVTERHVRVGLVEPGAVATELRTHLSPALQAQQAERYRRVRLLEADDVADAVAWIATRPAHVAINEVLLRPTEQQS